MKRLIPFLALPLAACATPFQLYDVESFVGAPAPASRNLFQRTLFTEYQGLVHSLTVDRYLWNVAAKYADKGAAIADGKTADPEVVVKINPATPQRCRALCLTQSEETVEWRVPEAQGGELRDARERLMKRFQAGARERQPEIAAKAQAAFDCWFEEQRLNLPGAECRGKFLALDGQLKG